MGRSEFSLYEKPIRYECHIVTKGANFRIYIKKIVQYLPARPNSPDCQPRYRGLLQTSNHRFEA